MEESNVKKKDLNHELLEFLELKTNRKDIATKTQKHKKE
jgi:hypothetical protein